MSDILVSFMQRQWLERKDREQGKECMYAQSCPTCSPLGSSVCGISQARILEWVAVFFSRGIFFTQGLKPHLLCLYFFGGGRGTYYQREIYSALFFFYYPSKALEKFIKPIGLLTFIFQKIISRLEWVRFEAHTVRSSPRPFFIECWALSGPRLQSLSLS